MLRFYFCLDTHVHHKVSRVTCSRELTSSGRSFVEGTLEDSIGRFEFVDHHWLQPK
jgi:hypothetical protein